VTLMRTRANRHEPFKQTIVVDGLDGELESLEEANEAIERHLKETGAKQ
jgi:hypothetical protein